MTEENADFISPIICHESRWRTSLDAMLAPQLHGNLNNARISTKPKKAFFKHRKLGKNVTMDFSHHTLIKKIRL